MIYFKLLKLKFSFKNHKVWEEWKQENSSNINEVIRSVLNFFFYKKISQAQNRLQQTKINVHKKHLSSNINEIIKTI